WMKIGQTPGGIAAGSGRAVTTPLTFHIGERSRAICLLIAAATRTRSENPTELDCDASPSCLGCMSVLPISASPMRDLPMVLTRQRRRADRRLDNGRAGR